MIKFYLTISLLTLFVLLFYVFSFIREIIIDSKGFSFEEFILSGLILFILGLGVYIFVQSSLLTYFVIKDKEKNINNKTPQLDYLDKVELSR